MTSLLVTQSLNLAMKYLTADATDRPVEAKTNVKLQNAYIVSTVFRLFYFQCFVNICEWKIQFMAKNFSSTLEAWYVTCCFCSCITNIILTQCWSVPCRPWHSGNTVTAAEVQQQIHSTNCRWHCRHSTCEKSTSSASLVASSTSTQLSKQLK